MTNNNNNLGRIGLEFHKGIDGHLEQFQHEITFIESIINENRTKNLNKSIALLVGRGHKLFLSSSSSSSMFYENELPDKISSLELKNIHWIHLDYFGGSFDSVSVHHNLWCDFNNAIALSFIPTGIFDLIVVDSSTWRYLRHADKQIMAEWGRILNSRGKFVFEFGISSIQYSLRTKRMTSASGLPKTKNKTEEKESNNDQWHRGLKNVHRIQLQDHLKSIQNTCEFLSDWYYEHDNFSHATFVIMDVNEKNDSHTELRINNLESDLQMNLKPDATHNSPPINKFNQNNKSPMNFSHQKSEQRITLPLKFKKDLEFYYVEAKKQEKSLALHYADFFVNECGWSDCQLVCPGSICVDDHNDNKNNIKTISFSDAISNISQRNVNGSNNSNDICGNRLIILNDNLNEFKIEHRDDRNHNYVVPTRFPIGSYIILVK